jgi:hypothetical protein
VRKIKWDKAMKIEKEALRIYKRFGNRKMGRGVEENQAITKSLD